MIAMRAEEERRPAFTAQTNPQPQNYFAIDRHLPSPAGLDNGSGFVAPYDWFTWVPDEGRHTGTPSLPTYGVPSLTPAFDATIYNFSISWMTTGRMTCASGADDVFLWPLRKLRFQMIDNMSGKSPPTSSRNIVPRSAISKRPNRHCVAPVKAPFSWPNNSDATRSRGIAAQFTLTKACEDRRDRRWMARATPVTRTLESVGATLEMRDSTLFRTGEVHTISSNIDALSISSRNQYSLVGAFALRA
jgi:hypothetical protein